MSLTLSLPPVAAVVLAVIAKATLVLAIAWAGSAVLTRLRAPAAARHLVWTVAVCAVLALPLLSLVLPAWRVGFITLRQAMPDFSGAPADVVAATAAPVAYAPEAVPPALPSTAPAAVAPVVDYTASPAPDAADAPIVAATTVETEIVETAATVAPLPPAPPEIIALPVAGFVADDGAGSDVATWLALAYAAVALVLLARIVAGRASVRRLAARAVTVTDPEWTGLVRDLAWTLDIDRPVTLLRGGSATMPMTWGIVDPTILLPAEAATWTTERLRVVLLHELAHVARHDCLTQTLASVACALYWFHPGAWHAARRLRVERELACDDRVLTAGTRAREYAAHLLEVARGFHTPALAGTAAIGMARPSQLEGRLLAVLDGVRDRRAISPRMAAPWTLAAAALIVPLAAMRPGVARAEARNDAPPPVAAMAMEEAPVAAAIAQTGCVVRQETRFDCQLAARAGERLILELPRGAGARVTGRDRDGVALRSGSGSRVSLSAQRVAGGVRVVVTRAEGDRGGPDVLIDVPRRFDVQAAADGGGVELRDLRGTFTGHTRGGGLALVRTAGTLRMNAGGGGAYLQDTALDGVLEMGGGGVMMGENRGNLDVRDAGGTVHAALDAEESARRDMRDDARAAASADRGGAPGRAVAIAREGGPIEVRYAPEGAVLSTGGGDIRVMRASGHVLAETGGGDVSVESLAGSARLRTGTGDVSVRVAGSGGDLDLTSGSGTVTVVLPADFSGVLDLESAYTQNHAPTRVTSDFPVTQTRTDGWDTRQGSPRRYVRGRATLGSGRNRVHVTTVNGDVRVVRGGTGRESFTTRIDGGDVTCAGEDCTIRLNNDGTVTWTGGSGPRTSSPSRAGTATWQSSSGDARPVVIGADADGYAYVTGEADERIESIRAMARYAPAEAAAQGIARLGLEDRDARVQRAAVDALAGLRGAERDRQLRRIAREHRSVEIRERAAAALR